MHPRRLGLVSVRLQYFLSVAQLGSIRRAAQALNIVPSAVSRTIQQLEREFGTPLFERARQRLKLTSAGEILLYHARSSVAELDRASAFIGDLQGLKRGRVGIAAVESATRGLLPDVLSRFWKRYPDVSVEVRMTGSQQALAAVLESDCDLGIAFDVRIPKSAQRLAGASLKLGALVRPDHRLAKKRDVQLRDFAGERLVLSDTSLTLGVIVEAAMKEQAVEFTPRAVTNSIHLMTDFALRGHGAAFQTRVGVERELERGSLIFLPLADPQLRPRKLLLIGRAKAHLPGAPAALAKMLSEAIESL